jgi:phage I-like protein
MHRDRIQKVIMALESLAPETFIIFPLGQVTGEGIESFTVDEESIRQVQDEHLRKGIDLVVDYEHQSLGGGVAPAAGWITGFFKKENALACSIKWTEKAREYISQREYRYFSPVAKITESRRLAGFQSMALTNLPVGHNLQPLVPMKNDGGRGMKKILGLLGLTDTSTEDDVVNAIKSIMTGKGTMHEEMARTLEMSQTATHEEVMGRIAQLKFAAAAPAPAAGEEILTELGLQKGAGKSEVIANIRAMKQTIVNGINPAEFQVMKQRLAAIETEKIVTLAMSEGKITAAQREWAEKYATDDPEGFKLFTEKAPVIVTMKQVAAGNGPEKKPEKVITEEDKAVMGQMGVTEEEFRKYNK